MRLTSGQVADKLGISRYKVGKLVHRGILKDLSGKDPGSRHEFAFDSAEVNALVRENRSFRKPVNGNGQAPAVGLTPYSEPPATVPVAPQITPGGPFGALGRIEQLLQQVVKQQGEVVKGETLTLAPADVFDLKGVYDKLEAIEAKVTAIDANLNLLMAALYDPPKPAGGEPPKEG